MAKKGLLEITTDSCKMGDLNLMLNNTECFEYPKIDPLQPQKPFFTGYIPVDLDGEEGKRRIEIYVPSEYPISGAGFFIWLPSGENARQYSYNSTFIKIAEERKAALIFLQSGSGGWDRDDIQKEVDYSLNAFKTAIARRYFSMNEATYYSFGLGDGAYVAAAFTFLYPEIFSCFLVDGDCGLKQELSEQIWSLKSERDSRKTKGDVPLPAWIIKRGTSEESKIVSRLMEAGTLIDDGIRDGISKIYKQGLKTWKVYPDGLPICELRTTEISEAKKTGMDVIYKEMFAFALRFKRWLGIGNGDLRPAKTYRDMGLLRKEMIYEGRKRYWHVYLPTCREEEPAKALPLVIAIHGYSCTGELFAENSGWHETAESRGFIVVFVSAFPSNKNFKGTTVPLPTWNAVGMESETDDIGFIEAVITDTLENYEVDSERIYVTGHSNGSLMTQTLMAKIPKKFAAFAPEGAQYHMDLTGDENAGKRDISEDGILRPVWLMMGEEDIGDGASLESGSANDMFLNMMCRVNGLDREADQVLENGKYITHTFSDKNNVPIVKFSEVKSMPHAYTPEISWIYWDQFLCHFRRLSDGSIVYTP